MVDLNKVNFNTKNLASSQLKIMGSFEDASQLQSYITQIQAIKTASRGLFKPTPITDYANAIQGLEARQAALLLSTQGLTNAQIAETLAINESSVAKNYQAMADAGLLKRKQTLTAVQIQENLQTVLGAEADTSAAMSALGLSGAIEGQGYQTVKLTAKKLEEAVATNVLTEAQAKELAMRTGVTLSMTAQAAGSLPKWIAMIKAGTIAVWDQIKATAVWLATTPAGWAVSATAAIGGLIFTLDKLAQSEKKASDQAVELYENSKEKVKTNQEETDSLNELVEKYKELKSNSNLSSDNRNEIKQLQHDIAQLVGAEAQNLDLVNGKLDEQISKLQSIQAEKSKQNVEDARDNYYNAVYASDVITGGADKYGNDVSIKWNGAEARQIHKIEGYEHTKYNDLVKFFDDNGFGDIIRKNDNQTVMNMRFVVDTKDIDDIEQKIARLKEFKEFLADNGFKNTGLYQGVTSSIDRYSDQQNNELEAADILVNNIIENLSDSNEKLQAVSVESVQSFEEYRQKMIDEVQKDESIGKALADGTLSNEDIEMAVNNFMATIEQFSKWYEQGINTIKVKEILQDQFDEKIGELTLDELKIAAEQIEVDEGALLSWDELIAKIKEFQDFMQKTDSPQSSSITETIDQLNTQLKPTFDSLKSAYQDIFTTDDDGKPLFTLENVDLSMLDSIKSTLDELNENEELGINIDYSSFENLARILTDTNSTEQQVRDSFNTLADDIVNTLTPSFSEVSSESLQLIETLLRSLGIQNSEQVMIAALGYSYQQYTAAKQECADASFNLQNASQSEIDAFVNEQIASDSLGQSLAQLELTKVLVNNTKVETQDDINRILSLAQAAGIGAEALAKLAQFKTDLENETDPKTRQWIMKSINEYTKTLSQEIQNVQVDFTPKTDTNKSESKSKGSDKKETDKWLEEYKKKLAELQNQLDKGVINEREFFSQSEILLNTYLKDSKEHIAKYTEEISDAEKTLHGNLVSAYEYERDELGRLRDKNYINIAEYYRSMMSLQDEYYNGEALKLTNLADKMEAEYGRMSHINLTRPSIEAPEIQAAGYNTELTSSSVYAQSFGNETKQVVVTPILPDGTILSPEALTAYADQLLKGEKIDVDIELAMFDGKDAVKQTAEYVNGLENMQSEYQKLKQTLSESPYGNFTEDQLKALEELTKDVEQYKSKLSGELGDIKSAYDGLIEIRDTYNEYGKISVDQYQSLCDMGFQYLALLSDENGALSLDEEAFQRLADAKIQEMQVTMALQAVDLINNIQTEEQAIQYLAASYGNLANQALSAAESMLYAARANMALEYGESSMQVQAADTIIKGYENSKLLVGKVDLKMQSGGGYPEEKEKKEKEEKEKEPEERDWAEKLLEKIEKGIEKAAKVVEKISDQTDKLIDKVDKFFSWQKKNAMINRAVKSTDKEIKANSKEISQVIDAIKHVKDVTKLYSEQLDKSELSDEYKDKIKNGKLEIEEIEDEGLQEAIKKYENWYEKLENCKDKVEEYNDTIQECRDAMNELYEQQRSLIKQKLDNVLSYYSDLDSYLSSITSKMESLISLNDAMGKRSSLTELVEQFATLSDQITSVTTKEVGGVTITEGSLGDSKRVADAVNRDRKELADSIQDEIDNLDVDQSGTYTKLLKNIEKTEAKIDKYIEKGWDVTKSKQFEKLTKKLQNYYDLQSELDNWATSNTIVNYQKVYTAYQKLQNKLDSGKDLTKSEQKKYDRYLEQIEALRDKGSSALDKLYDELAEANGTAPKQSEADKVKDKISGIQTDLEESATYRNLMRNIEKTEDKLAALDEKGYDNLTKKQKKTYDKLQAQLEAYYAQKESLDENATASNIVEYNKIYLAWKKLQDKIDKGGNLSVGQWKKYDQYTEQLENYAKEKADVLSRLDDELAEALNPSSKLDLIEKTYEEAAEETYNSYHEQIDDINREAENTQQYQNLSAKAQKLEQKKDTRGLTKAEQAQLDKYNAELEALNKGATGTNITEYMKTWEAWYKLQQKLDNGKNLSASEAKKYDTYKAKLDAWNNEKQTQINDLLSQMEDDLEQLQKTYTENVSEAESDISDYFANLYSLAKQIAEYNLKSLQDQLSYLDGCISYYKELVSLYDSFSGEKLKKILTDLGTDELSSEVEIYSQYLDTLKEKYNTTLSEMNEYSQLLDALDTNDFEASMALFDKAMEDYKAKGNIAMADKLQSVLDLLNERAVNADNWEEYADLWALEWENALTSTKQELIGTANEIQEVNDALRQIRFENITDAISELEIASGILSSITSLIKDDWLFEADGELSEYGQAKAALLMSEFENAQAKANEYLNLYNEIQQNEDTYASKKAYMADLNEAAQNYYDTLNSTATLESSIIELMKRNAEEELNSLKKLIEARKKALQKKKEYYDYDKTIKNAQKEIDSIKAQIEALESLTGATDAATKAKLAQLKAELAEKEDALKETKEEHTINMQTEALDEFANTLADALDNSTKSVEEIMREEKDLMAKATEIYKETGDNLGETVEKLTAFYKGMGIAIDGTDLTPNGTGNADSNTLKVNTVVNSQNTDVVSAVKEMNTSLNSQNANVVSAVKGVDNSVNTNGDKIVTAIKENKKELPEGYISFEEGVSKGLFLQLSDDFIRKNGYQAYSQIPQNRFIPQVAEVATRIPDYVLEKKNTEPVVINNHYDSLINVEGSVDKNFMSEWRKDMDKTYRYMTSRLYQEQRKLR